MSVVAESARYSRSFGRAHYATMLSNILRQIPLFFSMTLYGIRDFGISASAVSPIDGSSTYDVYSNVDWSCTSNLTCSTPLSFCNEENKCQCPPGYVFNAAMTACLEAATAYGDNCTETSQCVAYMSVGGTCTNGSCNCATGYHYLHGRCNKSSGLGEKCQTDDDCFANADFEALSCKNESCQCSEGFYQREYRTCRRAGTAIGAECVIDLDCTFDKKARCDKQSGCYASPKIASYSNASESSNDLASHSRELREVDVRLFSKLGCTEDSECTHLGPSVCTGTGRCICKHGYGFDSKKENCIPELGEICRSDSDVAIKYSICRNGRWSCGGARVPSKNNLECLKITRSFNSFCKSDEQCYVFGPDSVCTKQCVCNENSHYVEDEMFCWRNGGIGESCQKDADCYVAEFRSKLTCNEKYECSCPVGTHVNTAKTACIDDNPFIGSSCSADVDCKPLSNVRCFNESCVCNDTYFNLSGVCVAGIDAPCKTSHDCNTKNATCVSEICQCGKGLVSPAPGICIPVSPFGGECQYDVQCSASVADARCFKPEVAESDESTIIGAKSRTIGSCKCDAGQHRKYEKCYRTRVLDETCYSRGECYVKSNLDSVHCLKGVCTCDFDARRINSTFCENDASAKLVALSLLISSLLFAMNFSR